MRHLAFALLFVSPLLATGCNKNDAENTSANVVIDKAAAELYEVTAGAITGNRTPGINSSFKIKRSKSGIESDRYGGACIIFRASDLGYDEVSNKVCSSDADCQNSKGPGYCDVNSHQCWARPNVAEGAKDPFCNRSIDYDPQRQWNEGELNWISAQAIPVPQGLKPNAQARAVALLRGKPGATPPAVSKWGDPKPIP